MHVLLIVIDIISVKHDVFMNNADFTNPTSPYYPKVIYTNVEIMCWSHWRYLITQPCLFASMQISYFYPNKIFECTMYGKMVFHPERSVSPDVHEDNFKTGYST